MLIGKAYTFEAAHSIPGHAQCGVIHGHTWTVTVEVQGVADRTTGIVLDFKNLSEYINPILKQLDHSSLNDSMPIPTCERIALSILLRLRTHIQFPMRVTVQEGQGGYARTDWR